MKRDRRLRQIGVAAADRLLEQDEAIQGRSRELGIVDRAERSSAAGVRLALETDQSRTRLASNYTVITIARQALAKELLLRSGYKALILQMNGGCGRLVPRTAALDPSRPEGGSFIDHRSSRSRSVRADRLAPAEH